MTHSNEAYIYTFVNKVNGKVYIGSRADYAGTAEEDFKHVYNSSARSEEFWQDLQNGELEGEILFVMKGDYSYISKRAVVVEHQMIKAFWDKYGREMSYNGYCNGEFSVAGRHWTLSEETRTKIGASLKGIKRSEETCKRISQNHADQRGENAPMYGKKHSEETRKKISQNHADFSGEKNPNYGKPRSEETRAKISNSLKGKKASEETCAKLSAAHKDKPQPTFRWLTPDGEIKTMAPGVARRWHPDWILLGPADE